MDLKEIKSAVKAQYKANKLNKKVNDIVKNAKEIAL